MPTENKPAEPFQREDRYIVLKLNRLLKDETEYLRDCQAKAMVDCVVVEHDWPEYHLVWAMIEHRMAGKPVPDFNLWRRADELQQRLNAADQRIDELAAQHGEHVALVPVERSYDVRAQQILAFNTSKQSGGDLDDALGAAYKAALRYTPHPGQSPAIMASREDSIAWLKRIDGIGQNRAELIYSMGFRRHTESGES